MPRVGSPPILARNAIVGHAIQQVSADEGMWTVDAFPADRVEKAYGFAPDQAWLDHVRLSSVRLAFGCSASFVSSLGLMQTNHHCAQGCIAQLSTRTDDLVEAGFYAKTAQDERKCPNVEVAISDVTARVDAATAAAKHSSTPSGRSRRRSPANVRAAIQILAAMSSSFIVAESTGDLEK
jgi:Peptidase S46